MNTGPDKIHPDKSSVNKTDENEYIDIYPGEVLTTTATVPITRAYHTQIIVLAGANESGKTTILSSIYEQFQNGPFAGFLFAGSKTLLAFERCCHDSRMASGNVNPLTTRTHLATDEHRKAVHRLLHLQVRPLKGNHIIKHLLFTDVSGELYEGIRHSSDECKRHKIFLRSDHFVLLLDGERLCDPLKADKVVDDSVYLLRQCLDSNMLGQKSYVDIIFSKYDIIKAQARNNPHIKQKIDRIIKKFERMFTDRLGKLRFYNVAARPDLSYQSRLPEGYGLKPLFKSWVEDFPPSRLISKDKNIKITSKREIDRFNKGLNFVNRASTNG